jgi:hypothetical protein
MSAATVTALHPAIAQPSTSVLAAALNRLRSWLSTSNAPVVSEADIKALEAEELRRLARGYMRDEPSFAADLFAAADRHELG